MIRKHDARTGRKRRHTRVRIKVQGTADRPRLSVFRSLNNIRAQVIDDKRGQTLAAASTLDSQVKTQVQDKSKTEAARLVGALLAERAMKGGITEVVFDRGGYKYHGRVKAVAEAARKAGLVF